MDTEYYDDIIIGGGKAGKTLAPALRDGVLTHPTMTEGLNLLFSKL